MKDSEEHEATMTVCFLINASSELRKRMDEVCRLYKVNIKFLVIWAFRSFLSSGRKFEDIVLTKEEYLENLYNIRHRDDYTYCPVKITLREAERIRSFCDRSPLGAAAFISIKIAIVSRHVDSLLEGYRNDLSESGGELEGESSLSLVLLERSKEGGQEGGQEGVWKQITTMLSLDTYKRIMAAAEMHRVSYTGFVRNLAVHYVNSNSRALFGMDFDDGKEKLKRMSIYFKVEDYEKIKEFAARSNMKMSPALVGIVLDSIGRMGLPEVA